jgi:hypothetical protein
MKDLIKPLIGTVIIAFGVGIILFGVGLLIGGGCVLSTLGAFLAFGFGAEVCQLGYIVTQGGDIHETFILRRLGSLYTKQ